MKDLFDLDNDGKLNSVELAYLVQTFHNMYDQDEDSPVHSSLDTEDTEDDFFGDFGYESEFDEDPDWDDAEEDLYGDFGYDSDFEEDPDEDDAEEDIYGTSGYDPALEEDPDTDRDELEEEADSGSGIALSDDPLSKAKQQLGKLADRLFRLKLDLDEIKSDLELEFANDPDNFEMELFVGDLDDISFELDGIYDRLFDLSL
ncbi:MAG: hypothetical protein ILO68_07055 [Clostridia bacterium]|nr:hypothetical protein [Clostridia bacterium]